MDWKKSIGYGVLLWILMFVIVSIFIAFKIYNNQAMQIIIAIIGGIIAYVLAGKVRPANYGEGFGYGLTWLVTGVILDALITMRFNPAIFSSWYLWLGYVFGVVGVLLSVKKA